MLMKDQPNWRAFYETLRHSWLEVLDDVDPRLRQLIRANLGGDQFWSESLAIYLNEWWHDDPEKAVREVIGQWAANVRARLREDYGGLGMDFFMSDHEDADDLPDLKTMIANIHPRYDQQTIGRLVEAARFARG
jgi:hypothetical protein